MQRKAMLWVFVIGCLIAGATLSASDFAFRCSDDCAVSDSGTATGDGTGGVGTSNGTAGFLFGEVPSLSSLGITDPADLRFQINMALPTPATCNSGESGGIPNPPCDFNYTHVSVDRLRFFVVNPSSGGLPYVPTVYCQGGKCDPLSEVQLDTGDNLSGFRDAEMVIFDVDLIKKSTPVLVGGSLPLQLADHQARKLLRAIEEVKEVDPTAEFFIGFSVRVSAVDATPKDESQTRLTVNQPILSIATSKAQ